jgi:cytidylate kinase
LAARGENTDFDTVLEDVKARDARDSERAVAPLVPADDAISIDTSGMSIKDAIAAAIAAVDSKHG